ncbi:hypothetical protein [Polyangium sorediatum]|uniref:Uncharacterized protein n=1 Tax=Polyangium sorediatum TaxID=889274 RepID=A0ABT6NJB3_9BACT|nr:hypothetical protein [Polyangium sorediatum]MDI1428401.1 hypothetical protein [Polyangium sorediatum]
MRKKSTTGTMNQYTRPYGSRMIAKKIAAERSTHNAPPVMFVAGRRPRSQSVTSSTSTSPYADKRTTATRISFRRASRFNASFIAAASSLRFEAWATVPMSIHQRKSDPVRQALFVRIPRLLRP